MARLLVIISILICSLTASARSHIRGDITELPYFNGIDVDDNIRVIILNDDGGGPRVSKSLSDHVSAQVKENVLILRRIADPNPRDKLGRKSFDRPMFHQPPVTVTVWAHDLNFLRASEYARVTMEDVDTCCGIDIITSDNAQVRMRGVINLKKLTTSGNSCVNAMWVKSYHVKMCITDHSKVVLAGYTCTLDAALNSSSNLDATFLRANEVYIKTTDYACAKVLPIFALYGFAKNYSGIYYYKTPQFITRNGTESGNVLQMEYWR